MSKKTTQRELPAIVSGSTRIEIAAIEKAGAIMKAFDHPLRLKIITEIAERKEVMVGGIYRKLEIEQSITSQHLKILRDAEIVNSRKVGKAVYYSINQAVLEKLAAATNKLQ